MFCFSLQKKIITIPNSMVLFFSTDLLRNSTHDLVTPHYLDFNYHVSPQLSMGGTCVRLPYEESSIKMGNTQEVNVNKGVLDRVEARQDGAASTKQIKKYCLALSRFSNVLNPSRFVQIRLYRIVLSLFENSL